MLAEKFSEIFNFMLILKNGGMLFFSLIFLICGCTNNRSQTNFATNKFNGFKNPTHPIEEKSVFLSDQGLTSFLNSCKIIKNNKQARPPFNKLNYNKILAYDYEGVDGEHVFRIVENNKLVQKINKQRQLTQKQADNLTNWLGVNSTYGNTYAFCFEPHFGLVFYHDNQIVASISISIGCNYLESSIPIPATKAKSIEITIGQTYPAKGFSESGSKKLIALEKELNLTSQ